MAIEIKMPALSPTMEEGTLAKWLVKEGDTVKSGDLLAEIETDKATMEFEAVDEGTIATILVPEGSDNVKVGTVIATIAGDGEDVAATTPQSATPQSAPASPPEPARSIEQAEDHGLPPQNSAGVVEASARPKATGGRIKASPLARRIAAAKGLDLASLSGSGPGGRIVKADLEAAASPASAPKPVEAARTPAPVPSLAPSAETKAIWYDDTIPHEVEKLSSVRKTIARRLTEAKQTIPHIYLTLDVRLDALLKLRGELNAALSSRDVKLSVNDLLVKALGVALDATPKCNVTFLGTELVSYKRADISVAVSTPTGLITPIIRDVAHASLSSISTQMKELAGRAKEGKLKPEEYQGGTASISNMGMYGIKQFAAVINPPQGMILAIGAGEKRPFIVDDALGVATVMSVTGSFDHRAIDGADGAELMTAFKALVEAPLGMIA